MPRSPATAIDMGAAASTIKENRRSSEHRNPPSAV